MDARSKQESSIRVGDYHLVDARWRAEFVGSRETDGRGGTVCGGARNSVDKDAELIYLHNGESPLSEEIIKALVRMVHVDDWSGDY